MSSISILCSGCTNNGASSKADLVGGVSPAQALHAELTGQASALNQDPAYQLTADDIAALSAEGVADASDQAKLKIFTQN